MPVYCNKAKDDKMQNILDLENISIYITVFISAYNLILKIDWNSYNHILSYSMQFLTPLFSLILFIFSLVYTYLIKIKINLFSKHYMKGLFMATLVSVFSVGRRTQLGQFLYRVNHQQIYQNLWPPSLSCKTRVAELRSKFL